MSTTSDDSNGGPAQTGLFGDGGPANVDAAGSPKAVGGAPRLAAPVRNQVELRPVDLDSTLAADHPARTVWLFVQALDLAPLYARVRSVQGRAGAPAIDPAILVALWLWATIDGVGSAREIDRRCDSDDAYRWICGGVGVNYHTLADFRTQHEAWLDAQLTNSIASLLARSLVKLEVVSQDGLRVRASAKAASFRRRDKLQELHSVAQAQVQALKDELQQDASASSRRKQAARERAVIQREQRLGQALSMMNKITEAKQPKPSKRRGKGSSQRRKTAKAAAGATKTKSKTKLKPAPQPRVSTTDAQARVLKMADGGFRPAFNVQVVVDVETQLIAAVDVGCGSDMKEMSPMHAQVQRRYQITPTHWLADGGFGKMAGVQDLYERGTQPVVPPYKTRNPLIDPLEPKRDDTAEVTHWRKFMATEWAKDLYIHRAATVECVNAHLRRRGLTSFNVRGVVKARAVALWHALAHNLMRLQSLGISAAALKA